MFEVVYTCTIATLMVTWLFVVYRAKVAYENRLIVLKAIADYDAQCGNTYPNPTVYLSDMEEYKDTLLRFWDFGCERILPEHKYKIIQPYIR